MQPLQFAINRRQKIQTIRHLTDILSRGSEITDSRLSVHFTPNLDFSPRAIAELRCGTNIDLALPFNIAETAHRFTDETNLRLEL